MYNFQLFIIIGANVVAIAMATNLKLLPFKRQTMAATATNGNRNNISSSSNNSYSNHNNIDDEAFVQFLKYLSQEQSFTTIVILTNCSKAIAAWQHNHDYCVNLKYFMDYFQHYSEMQNYSLVPVLLLQSQQMDYMLHDKFNSGFVTILCIPRLNGSKVMEHHLLLALSKNLWYLRKNRVIIRLDFEDAEEENKKNIARILNYCHNEKIINIIIVSYKFPYETKEYYSFENFPKFKIIKLTWRPEHDKIFPDKLRNLKGSKLLTIPDQIAPRSIVYYDKQGNQQMMGYVGHFVQYLAKGLNASLVWAYKVKQDSLIFYSDILKLTRNHIVDIPASLTGPINNTDWSEFSYPPELASWCVMLPMEAEISMAAIFLRAMNPYFVGNLIILYISFSFLLLVVFKRISSKRKRLNIVDLLINDKALRAILGQGFPFNNQKLDYFVVFIFILLFFTGLVVVTLYGVFLGSFMTSPPKHSAIKSFADLERSGTKLLISQQEYELIYPSDYLQYPKLFKILDSFQEFVQLRNTLNTTYAYIIPSSRWSVFAAQQKLFSRQLFRYSTDLCFTSYVHLYFILPMHSLYRDILYEFILKSYSSGLFFHWYDSSFHELVSLGRMSLTDITQGRILKPTSVEDLKFIFFGFSCLMLIAVVTFVIERICGMEKWRKADGMMKINVKRR
ncbi:uncharacterized protein ACRADG_012643 [Cochliomyia hominivorax]